MSSVPVPASVTRSYDRSTNASMVDRRAWLEVEDPKHRYAKNLRMYFKEYDRQCQGQAPYLPLSTFWEWLETSTVEVREKKAHTQSIPMHYDVRGAHTGIALVCFSA